MIVKGIIEGVPIGLVTTKPFTGIDRAASPAELDCDVDPRRFHLGDKPQFFRHSGPRLWIHPQHQHESTDKDQQETCRRLERLRER